VLLVDAAGHCSLLLCQWKSVHEELLIAAGHCRLLLRQCQSWAALLRSSPRTFPCVCCARRWRLRRSPCTDFCVCRAGICCEIVPSSLPPATSVLLVDATGHCSLLLRQ